MNVSEWNDWTKRAWARVHAHRDATMVYHALTTAKTSHRADARRSSARRLHQAIVDGRFGFTKFAWGPCPTADD